MSTQRSALVSEASDLVEVYREVTGHAPGREDIELVGLAIARALIDLDHRWTQETLDRAALQLAAARDTLTRIRRALED